MTECLDTMICPRCGGEGTISSTNKPCDQLQIICPWCGFFAYTSFTIMDRKSLKALRREDYYEMTDKDFAMYTSKAKTKKRIKEFDQAYGKQYVRK